MGELEAQGRLGRVQAERWQVLRRRGEGRGRPDQPGRSLLRPVRRLRQVLQQGQEDRHPVHRQTRAEH